MSDFSKLERNIREKARNQLRSELGDAVSELHKIIGQLNLTGDKYVTTLLKPVDERSMVRPKARVDEALDAVVECLFEAMDENRCYVAIKEFWENHQNNGYELTKLTLDRERAQKECTALRLEVDALRSRIEAFEAEM